VIRDAGVLGSFRLDDLVEAAQASAEQSRLVVLIDGPSGAGKTTLAGDLVARLEECWAVPVQFVTLDDVYPGWHGLAAATAVVETTIVASEAPGYRRYDWATGSPAEWVSLDPLAPLVVEGSGALTVVSASRATLRVWIEADATTRQRNAFARDGAGYEPWWDVWAAQEREHRLAHDPVALADVLINPYQGVWWRRADEAR